MQDFFTTAYFLFFNPTLASPLSVLIIIGGFIFGLLNESRGVKRAIYFFLVSAIISLLYNAFYTLFFNPYILIDLKFLREPYIYIQVGVSLIILLGVMYLAVFIKRTIKKQVETSVQDVGSRARPEIPSAPQGNIWKILILVFGITVPLAVGGYFGYQRLIVVKKFADEQKKLQEKYQKDLAKIQEEVQRVEEDDKKYLSNKIATIFVMGGNVLSNDKGIYPESASVEYYNPQTNTWTPAPNLQTPRAYASAVGTTDKVYVFGGTTGLNPGSPLSTVESFDPKTNTWSYRQSIPEEKSLAAAVFLNGKIYLIGGQGKSFKKLNSVDIYDPQTDQWVSGPPMPGTIVREAPACGAVGQKIYCLGVVDKGYTLVLDTATNTWEKLGTENRSNTFIGQGVGVKNSIIGVVSRPPEGTYLSIYNFTTDSYSKEFTNVYYTKENKAKIEFPKVIDSFGVASLDDYLLVIGGDTTSGPRSEVYAINTAYPRRWFAVTSLNTAREHMAVAVLPIVYGSDQSGYGSISGTVFVDTNKNFQLDSGERAIPNAKIILTTTRTYYTGEGDDRKPTEDLGNDIAATYTDSQGNYKFNNVVAGRYQVQVENPQKPGERKIVTQYLSGGQLNQSLQLQSGQNIENYNFNILEFSGYPN